MTQMSSFYTDFQKLQIKRRKKKSFQNAGQIANRISIIHLTTETFILQHSHRYVF